MIGKSIELDKMRCIKFDFNAMADFEDVYGKSLMEMLSSGMISFGALRALLWAGLKHEDRQLAAGGPAKAGEIAQEWLDKSGGDIADLTQMVTDALIDAGFVKVEPNHVNDAGSAEGGQGNC